DSCAQNRPSLVMNPTRKTGTVPAWAAVRFTAQKNSVHEKMTQINAVAAMPGATTGSTTRYSSVGSVAPSTRAASIISVGTSRKNERIIHTASGRFMPAYNTTSAQTLSSMPRFCEMTYSGMIAATIGSIFVDRKNPSALDVCLIGASESAYAAGTPSSSTSSVETTVTNAEFAR